MMLLAERLVRDQVLWLLGLKKSFLTRYRNVRKEPIKTYWWQDTERGIINFGDEITKDIVNSIFGHQCARYSFEECELIGAGSLLEMAQRRRTNNTIHVWGSGYIKERESDDNPHDLVFHAVRGKRTLARIGGEKKIALGDPGLLANIVYRRSKQRTDKIGVVVHYIDSDLPIISKIKSDTRFVIINPLDTPKEVARQISSCHFVLSSSLHGLIFADSFGVPNYHVQLSGRVTGGEYKFRDYYSATNREYRAVDVGKVFDQEYLGALKSGYSPIANLRRIQRNLVRSFPSKW